MTDSPTRAPLSYGAELLGRVLAGTPASESPLTHVAELPARTAAHTDWPRWVNPDVVAALTERGVSRPWSHQSAAASLAHEG
ncbi:MAG: DEAD/DEAH box helicase, partial [Mycobacteriaceae bacterium]